MDADRKRGGPRYELWVPAGLRGWRRHPPLGVYDSEGTFVSGVISV